MKPLTPEMAAAIERMVRTQSVALVRVHSQWWIAENDLPDLYVDAGMAFNRPVFWTSTVNSLVARGKLRFVGRKVRPGTYPRTPHYQRAEFRHT